MPELPEVETVARLIRPKLEGRRIEGARVGWKPTVGGDVPRFRRGVAGATVVRVWRRAKYVVFDLERDGRPAGCVVGHLRMTGRMHVEPADWDPGVHGHVTLPLDDGRRFHFLDVRKFGRLLFARAPEEVLAEGWSSARWLPRLACFGCREEWGRRRGTDLDGLKLHGGGTIYLHGHVGSYGYDHGGRATYVRTRR